MVLRAPAAFESIINTTLDAFGLLNSTSSRAGTSIEIRQIEGSDPVTVVLKDRAMPYQEPSFKAVLKTKKTTYPGNPVATQQVLNPDDDNTTFEGMWKERFLKGSIGVNDNFDAVTSVDQALAVFENLARAGKLVRVQWLSFVRVGLLVGFDVKPQNAVDMKWELEFEWQSRDDSLVGSRAAAFEVPSPDDLLNLLNTIEDIVTMAPGLVQSFNAVIVSAIRDIGDKLGEVVNLLRVVEAVVSLPAQVEGAIRAAVLSLVRQVQELTRKLSDRWNESVMGKALALGLATSTTSPTVAGSQSSALTSQASYAAWSRSLTLSLGTLSFAAQRAYQGVAERVKPQGLRVVTVAEGETLYSLAEKLYGSPDFANFLAVANGLTSVRVPPGFQLRAPGRPFGALGQLEMSGGKQSGAAGSF
jgi:hypothetical protein